MTWESIRNTVQHYLEENREFHIDLLRRMVEINSFTENAAGVNALGALTAEIFAPLGFTAQFIPSVNPNYGRHLFLTRKGRTDRNIGLISHLDTVFSPEEEARNAFHWRPEGDRIYGPGTNDIKGGTVMIYMILATLQHTAPSVYEDITWSIMLDASEEADAEDFGRLCTERITAQTLGCLVFECGIMDRENFLLVVARKGRAIFNVRVEGRGAHAGSAHPAGANAITQLADVVQQIDAITDYTKDLTVCVAIIKGGTVNNRVPHFAEAELEMRAFSPDVFAEAMQKIMGFNGYSSISNASGNFSCKVSVVLQRQTAPWPRNEGTERIFSIWKEVGTKLGYQAIPQERGGLSDGNLICHKVAVIDGLGPSGANAHCSERSADGSKEQEYVTVSSMIPKATMNVMGILRMVESM